MADHTNNLTVSRMDVRSDEDLFRDFLAQRNEELFARLVQRNEDFAYRLAFGYCGKPELAEEIAQDAFMKIARERSLDVLASYPSFKAWFSGVVLNVARHAVRTERRFASRTQRPEFLAMKKCIDDPDADVSEPAHLDGETRGALLRALSELSDELRLPVVMHFVEGMSQEDIGAASGVSQPTVSKRLQKGLNSLRVQLARMGVAVSAVTLPAILKAENLIQVPPSTHAERAKLAARALSQENHSMRAAATASGNAGKVAAAVVVVAAFGASAWLWSNQSQASVAPYEGSTPAKSTGAKDTPLPLSWTFDRPEVGAGFKIYRGTWSFKAKESDRPASMAVPDQVLVELPFKAPARPYKVTVHYNPTRLYHSVEFGCYYLTPDAQVPNESWAKRGSLQPQTDVILEYFCYQEWVLCKQDGIVLYLSKYAKPYITDKIGVSLRNGEMLSVAVDALPQETAVKIFAHPEQYIETNGFKKTR